MDKEQIKITKVKNLIKFLEKIPLETELYFGYDSWATIFNMKDDIKYFKRKNIVVIGDTDINNL